MYVAWSTINQFSRTLAILLQKSFAKNLPLAPNFYNSVGWICSEMISVEGCRPSLEGNKGVSPMRTSQSVSPLGQWMWCALRMHFRHIRLSSSYSGWTFTDVRTAHMHTAGPSCSILSALIEMKYSQRKITSTSENNMGTSARDKQVLIFVGSLEKVQWRWSGAEDAPICWCCVCWRRRSLLWSRSQSEEVRKKSSIVK